MATVDWARIQPLFDAVLERPPGNRADYMVQVCPEPGMRQVLQSLVLAWEQAGDFLETPALQDQQIEDERIAPGHRFGAYKIAERMGGGGMGTVYRAIRADDQYEKAVAIKVVRSGLASGFMLSRFRSERQILATLEHPNIARLLDGGTEEGSPWLAMELIDGEPIDQYCDRLCLSVRQRLELFRVVCSAVQYAHQHLIVHRDLKPSNILVTKQGVPKLLDFGIARLLGPEGLQETAGAQPMLMMTPDFASPEQMSGEPITTSSDVYSLGVLLYLLLTGRHPYALKAQSPQEMMRAVCESKPPRPSSVIFRPTESGERVPELLSSLREGPPEKLKRRLAGDLDFIVLKALAKDPSARYESVDSLSEDIRRHLSNSPIRARQRTLRYRASKFLSRNKLRVAGVFIVCLTLVTGLVATFREAQIANRRFNDVRSIASSDLFEIEEALQKIPGTSQLRYAVVQRALKYLDKLNSENLDDPSLLADLAAGYEKVAGLQGNFSGAGIGDSRDSLHSWEKALALRSGLVGRTATLDRLDAQAAVLQNYSRVLQLTGRTQDAFEAASRELAIAKKMSQEWPSSRTREADAHLAVSAILGGVGSSVSLRDIPAAIDHDRSAVVIWTEFADTSHDPNAKVSLIQAKLRLAEHLSRARRFGEAKALCAEVLRYKEVVFAPMDVIGRIHNRFGLTLEREGDQARALSEYRKSLQFAQAELKADPNDVGGRTSLQIAMSHISMQEMRLGVSGAVTAALDAGIEGVEKQWAADPYQTFYANLLLIGYAYQAEAALLRGQNEAAFALYSKSLATAERLAKEDAADLESRLSIVKIHDALAIVNARLMHPQASNRHFEAALQSAELLLRRHANDAETLYFVREVRRNQSTLGSCVDERPCLAASHLAVPSLIN